jgi:hypothetical protein
MPPKPIKKKKLKSGPHGHQPTVLGFTVESNGEITTAPARFVAAENDVVLWVIGNVSGQLITVTVTEFLLKDNNDDEKGKDEVHPFIWIGSNMLELAHSKVGVIAGLRDPNYRTKSKLFHDHLSYNIVVRSDAFNEDIVWDPDGEIKP